MYSMRFYGRCQLASLGADWMSPERTGCDTFISAVGPVKQRAVIHCLCVSFYLIFL